MSSGRRQPPSNILLKPSGDGGNGGPETEIATQLMDFGDPKLITAPPEDQDRRRQAKDRVDAELEMSPPPPPTPSSKEFRGFDLCVAVTSTSRGLRNRRCIPASDHGGLRPGEVLLGYEAFGKVTEVHYERWNDVAVLTFKGEKTWQKLWFRKGKWVEGPQQCLIVFARPPKGKL